MRKFYNLFLSLVFISLCISCTQKSDRYGLACENGIWWFKTPQGEKMVSLGINHIEPELMLANYNKENTLNLYGSDFVRPDRSNEFYPNGEAGKKWMSSVLKDIHDWNFNAIAYHKSVPEVLYKDSISYVKVLTPYRIEGYAGDRIQTPDVFSSAFREKVNDYVNNQLGNTSDKTNILGYAFSDMPLYQNPASVEWVSSICNQTAETEGKKHWIGLLKERYCDPLVVAKAYGISATSWKELAEYQQWFNPSSINNKKDDLSAFLSDIMEEWVKIITLAVKKYDKDGLIFGDKLNLQEWPDYYYPIIQKYIDVINIQFYGSLTPKNRKLLNTIYEKTKKPILIGDHAISMKSPNQEGVKGDYAEGCNLTSRKEVGEATALFIEHLMKMPFIVGWHICGYEEGWNGLSNYWQSRQCGLKDPFDKPYIETISLIIEANKKVPGWHQNAVFDD